MQLKAVILDYGNVLSAPQDYAAVEAMAAVFGVPVAAFERAYWQDRAAFDEAALSPAAYWRAVAAVLSRRLSEEDLRRAIALDNQSWAQPRPEMVRWAAALRAARVRTAILSNMPVTLRAYLEDSCDWLPAFDHRSFSCDIHMSKPAPDIFLHCLEGLGASAGETLFLDDREENVAAARALGMEAIRFVDPVQAQCEMDGRYALPAPIVGA